MVSSMSRALVAAFALVSVQAYPQPRDTPADNTDFLESLTDAPNAIRKYRKVLTKDGQGQEVLSGAELAHATTFDFSKHNAPVPGGQGGMVSMAGTETFPILYDTGLMVTMASLGPCGVFVPHVHPRANEFFLVIDGEVDFGYMLEMGLLKDNAPVPEITGKLTKNVGTVFPQGSVHFQVNNHCGPTTVVVSLSNDDPGTTPILGRGNAGGEGSDNSTMARRAVGREEFEAFRTLLPASIVDKVDKCFEACNIA